MRPEADTAVPPNLIRCRSPCGIDADDAMRQISTAAITNFSIGELANTSNSKFYPKPVAPVV